MSHWTLLVSLNLENVETKQQQQQQLRLLALSCVQRYDGGIQIGGGYGIIIPGGS